MTEIPSQIKIDNWAFHVLARSDDPAIRCLQTKNLISNLKTTMHIADITEHDALLYRAGIGANRAWAEYAREKNPGRAAQTAAEVLEGVLFLVYDKRFATPESDSFKGRGK
jgi:hypothetical protein